MHKLNRERTLSADWDDSERSINNSEDVYFSTFNTHFISLWVYVPFISAVLSHSRKEKQNNTIITALCCDDNMKMCHVLMLSTALQPAWYIYYSYMLCKYRTNLHFVLHLVLYDACSCNCTVAIRLSGTFSLLCEMGTQCLLLYLNTLIKQCWLLLLRWATAYSTAIA